MPDTTTTVVAVLVAGVAGPAITAWATTKAQQRRFDHERSISDIDDLRRMGTEAVTYIDELETIREGALRILYARHGHHREDLFTDPFRQYAEAVKGLNRARAQLDVRLDIGNEASAALLEIVESFVRVSNLIQRSQALQESLEPDEYKDVTASGDLATEPRRRFVEIMSGLAGSRITS